jgi:hypothetical protein
MTHQSTLTGLQPGMIQWQEQIQLEKKSPRGFTTASTPKYNYNYNRILCP